MTKKEIKEETRRIWIDQIKTAIAYADKAIEGCEDNGTCNFDMVLIRKESTFTYAETIDIFKECGITGACKANEYGRYYNGYIALPCFHGQAERNTKWAEAFRDSLKEQYFETSMYYQCD